HRIGDKIVLEACFRNFKNKHPDDKLVFFDDRREGSPSNELELDTMFRHCVDKYVPIDELTEFRVPQGDTGFNFGNLWTLLPKLRAKRIFPKISIPYGWRKWYNYFVRLEHPLVCVHILDNPPYNLIRKHNFTDFEEIIVYLAKQGLNVIRIGVDNGSVVKYNNVIDVTPKNLSIMASASIISECDIYIGGDTGMSHIAAALGKRIIAIYGTNEHDKKSFGDDWDSYPNTVEDKITVFIMKDNFIEGMFVAHEAVRFLDSKLGQGYTPVGW
ncbi:hypothetical protein LCGC14_1140280, partial [marine sediment metagenome]